MTEIIAPHVARANMRFRLRKVRLNAAQRWAAQDQPARGNQQLPGGRRNARRQV